MTGESFDASKISWARYCTADELESYLALGWSDPVFHAVRGGDLDCYVITWKGEGHPPELKGEGDE